MADLVDGDGIGSDDGAIAVGAGTHGEVYVFAVEPEMLVKSTHLLPCLALREQETSGDDADFPYAVSLPRTERLGVEDGVVAKYGTKTGREKKEAPDGRLSPARRAFEGFAVFFESLTAVESVLRVLLGEGVYFVDGVVEHYGVGIQKEKIAGIALPGGEVDGFGEAEVFPGSEEPHRRKLFADDIYRLILRVVVDDNHLLRNLVTLPDERLQAIGYLSVGVVGDDDDRNIGRFFGSVICHW